MSWTSFLQPVVDRLKQYNLFPFTSTNPFGLSGVGGADANYGRYVQDVATVAGAIAEIGDAVVQTKADIQGIADGIVGTLADAVPVTPQGASLVAATTPAAARAVIGAPKLDLTDVPAAAMKAAVEGSGVNLGLTRAQVRRMIINLDGDTGYVGQR